MNQKNSSPFVPIILGAILIMSAVFAVGCSGKGLQGSIKTYPPISKPGSLYVSVHSQTPFASMVTPGTTDLLFSKYKFTSVYEAFTVTNLDVVSDVDNSFTNFENNNDGNIAIITIKYKDAGGSEQIQKAPLSNGKASFSGMSLYVSVDSYSNLDIYADLNRRGTIAGSKVKLGIFERASSVNSFKAIGSLGTVVNAMTNNFSKFSVGLVSAMTLK
jgi:hypothetical protein